MEWKVRGIRGAITAQAKTKGAPVNTEKAIEEAVEKLLKAIEEHNEVNPEDIVCVFFTATKDLNATFPAKVARKIRPEWQYVPLLDLQQMHVEGGLKYCIRILIQINTNKPQSEIVHCYLGEAENLRADLNNSIPPSTQSIFK
ncbi:MAG: chorismate mutase [Xenococcaceae cyanobacterium MO_188.B32]|nr:chorismate mutase [Xenococcaceae cyanobacterium MO_188.B32]